MIEEACTHLRNSAPKYEGVIREFLMTVVCKYASMQGRSRTAQLLLILPEHAKPRCHSIRSRDRMYRAALHIWVPFSSSGEKIYFSQRPRFPRVLRIRAATAPSRNSVPGF